MERADLEQWKAREVARLLSLVETERRYYQEIVASVPVGLLVLSPDLSIISANKAIRKIFGLRSGDALRGRLDALLPGWVLDRVTEVLKSGTAQTNVLVESDADGKRRLRIAILPIRSWDDEAAQEALLSIEDLSQIEQVPQLSLPLAAEPAPSPARVAEVPEPLAPTPDRSDSELLNDVDAVVWSVELPANKFTFVSRHAEQLLGFPAGHWTTTESFWTERVHPADRDWVAKSYQNAIDRAEGHVAEFRALAADGSLVWLREKARVVADSQGRFTRLIGVTIDITERRLLDAQLTQAERVEAVSKLASRLAHDLNNMLMIVTGYGEELLNGLQQGSALGADVQEILTATERMAALTGQLLSFSRRQAAPAGTVELETSLGTVQQYLRVLLGEQADLEVKLSPESNVVKADASQLEQIIAAIAERLKETLHGKGRIRIETSRLDITEDLRRADTPLQPGAYGVITIRSMGGAFDGDLKSSLFESVLPGKEPWDDSGTAVSRAYGTIRQWGGDIAVSNEPFEGPVVRILLARMQETIEKPAEPKVAEAAPVKPVEPVSHLETVLVVEDEAGIRALVRKILRRQGYEVLEASNGEEALAICRDHAGEIDLLITDVIMPELGGRELVDRFHALRSGAKVLYVSGYTDDATIYSGKFPPGTAFLQKPFTLGALLDKVKEVLGSSA
ncbi:MAG TPA: response regulator [Bryobacteraceae bacterium]|nr:response regulator [Bryobacteraceae bacterium]